MRARPPPSSISSSTTCAPASMVSLRQRPLEQMRLEYFQLIDRIVELDVPGRAIKTLAQVPQTSTIFEGHFPGYPLMPGVLLTEAMAQTSGWLIVGVTIFTRMPFLAGVREAKLR